MTLFKNEKSKFTLGKVNPTIDDITKDLIQEESFTRSLAGKLSRFKFFTTVAIIILFLLIPFFLAFYDKYFTETPQKLSLSGDVLGISDGNTVSLSRLIVDAVGKAVTGIYSGVESDTLVTGIEELIQEISNNVTNYSAVGGVQGIAGINGIDGQDGDEGEEGEDGADGSDGSFSSTLCLAGEASSWDGTAFICVPTGGGTLEDAYNGGGPGGGRILNTISGAIELRDPIGASPFGYDPSFAVVGDGSAGNSTSAGLAIGKMAIGPDDAIAEVFSGDVNNITGTVFGYQLLNNTPGAEYYALGLSNMGVTDYGTLSFQPGSTNLSAETMLNLSAENGTLNLYASTQDAFITANASSDFSGALTVSNTGGLGFTSPVLTLTNSGVTTISQYVGAGIPEGIVTANSGSLYFRTDGTNLGNDHLYFKTSDGSNAGWLEIASTSILTSACDPTGDFACNGGNNLGTSLTIGTNDASDLVFSTNGNAGGPAGAGGILIGDSAITAGIQDIMIASNSGTAQQQINIGSDNFGTSTTILRVGQGSSNAQNDLYLGGSYSGAGNNTIDLGGSQSGGLGILNMGNSFAGTSQVGSIFDSFSGSGTQFLGLGDNFTNPLTTQDISVGSNFAGDSQTLTLGQNSNAINAQDIRIGINTIGGNQAISIGTSFASVGTQNIQIGSNIPGTTSLVLSSDNLTFVSGADSERWPTVAATAGQVLSADGFGQLSWVNSGACIPTGIGTQNDCHGTGALQSLTTGADNSAYGYHAGFSLDDGSNNTFIGSRAGENVTGGHSNIAIGVVALANGAMAQRNLAVGNLALTLSTADNNVAMGDQASASNTTGTLNTAVGINSALMNSIGNNNTSFGYNSLLNNTADGNTALGTSAGGANTTGINNTFLGYNSGNFSVTTISNSTAIGYNSQVDISNALVLGGTGVDQVFVGIGTTSPSAYLHINLPEDSEAIRISDNTNGDNIGFFVGTGTPEANVIAQLGSIYFDESGAGFLKTANDGGNTGWSQIATGSVVCDTSTVFSGTDCIYNDGIVTSNVFMGVNAGNATATGGNNVAIGSGSLAALDIGINNIAIGTNAQGVTTSASNRVAIGNGAMGSGVGGGDSSVAIGTSALALGGGASSIAIGQETLLLNNAGVDNVAIGFRALLSSTGDQTVAIGTEALRQLTTGSRNLAIGDQALRNITTQSDNLAIGYRALDGVGNTGSNNLAIGSNALGSNTSASGNLAIGRNALAVSTTASSNLAIGDNALAVNTASLNFAIGQNALATNITGNNNVAIGAGALDQSSGTALTRNLAIGFNALGGSSLNASNNLAIGDIALQSNTTGTPNLAIGRFALSSNTTGSNNFAIGDSALIGVTTGSSNLAVGPAALDALATTGTLQFGIGLNALGSATTPAAANMAIGRNALGAVTTGTGNLAIGDGALDVLNTTVNNNLAIGHDALGSLSTGTPNLAIGRNAGINVTTGSNNLVIGDNSLSNAASATAASNVILGHSSGNTTTTGTGNIIIGNSLSTTAAAASNECNIGGIIFCLTSLSANPRMGVGVNAPTDRVHINIIGAVNNGITIDGSATGNPRITMNSFQPLASCPSLGAVANCMRTTISQYTDKFEFQSVTGNNFDFTTAFGTPLMRLSKGGLSGGVPNVSFIPTFLAVGGTGATLANTTNALTVYGPGTAVLPAISIGSAAATSDSNTGIFSGGADIIGFTTGGTERARISATGDLGVGIAPSMRLHVQTAAAATTGILRLQNSVDAVDTFVTNATPEGAITASIGDIAHDATNGILYVKNTGTATNTGWLALSTTAGTCPPDTGNTVCQNGNTLGGDLIIGTNNANSLSFETSGTTRASMDTLGQWALTDSGTTGTGFAITANSLTTGSVFSTVTNSTSAFANGGVLFNFTGAHTGNAFQLDDITTAGNAMQLNVNALTTGNGLEINGNAVTSGDLLSVNTTSTSGFTNDGAVAFNFGGDHGGVGFGITDVTTGGFAQRIIANALTSGNGLRVESSSTAFTGNLISLIQSGDNAANTGNGLFISMGGTSSIHKALLTSVSSTGALATGGVQFSFTGAHTGNGVQIDDVTATGNAMKINATSVTTGAALAIDAGTTTGNIYINFDDAGTSQGSITNDAGNAVLYNTTSDKRLKYDIQDTRLDLSDLMKIQIHDFKFNNDSEGSLQTGFIAQELFEVFPDAVSTNGDDGEIALEYGQRAWGVDYGRITPLLVKSIQEVNNKVDNLNIDKNESEDTTISTENDEVSLFDKILDITTPLEVELKAGGSVTVEKTFVGKFFDRIAKWLADISNNIEKIFAKEIQTDKLCIGETCVTEAELKALLTVKQDVSSASSETMEIENSTTEDSQTSEIVTEEEITDAE